MNMSINIVLTSTRETTGKTTLTVLLEQSLKRNNGVTITTLHQHDKNENTDNYETNDFNIIDTSKLHYRDPRVQEAYRQAHLIIFISEPITTASTQREQQWLQEIQKSNFPPQNIIRVKNKHSSSYLSDADKKHENLFPAAGSIPHFKELNNKNVDHQHVVSTWTTNTKLRDSVNHVTQAILSKLRFTI